MAEPSFPWKNGKYLHARGGNFGEEDDEKGGELPRLFSTQS